MAKKVTKGEQAPVGIVQRINEYYLSLKFEWKKVTFPARKELIQSTMVVFLFTIILMLVISSYDAVMSIFFNKLILPVVPQ